MDSNQHWDELIERIQSCRLCPRLVDWREEVAHTRRRAYREQEYWGRPVSGFGDRQARLLIVGLAPGAHGANRTGRVFTGDGSGEFLFRSLYAAGFASQPSSTHREDGLVLKDVYITAVCRCAPPANKPTLDEINTCLPFMAAEMSLLADIRGIVALGRIAFDNTLNLLRSSGHSILRLQFTHGAFYSLGEGLPWMLASYHPSRQNTQTGRLTEPMFDAIWTTARDHLSAPADHF